VYPAAGFTKRDVVEYLLAVAPAPTCSRRDPNRSLIAPYSLRAAEVPLVSTPLLWGELERAAGADDGGALRFGSAQVLARLGRAGDPFLPVLQRGGQLSSEGPMEPTPAPA